MQGKRPGPPFNPTGVPPGAGFGGVPSPFLQPGGTLGNAGAMPKGFGQAGLGLPGGPAGAQGMQVPPFAQPKAGILGKAGAAQAAVPKQSAAALEKELGDLSKWLKHKRGDLGSFEVMLAQVVIRSMPSTKARIRSRLKMGDVVEGEVRGEWLLLNPSKANQETLDTGGGEWVLIDGTNLDEGIGVVLKRVLPEPEVRREFGTALEVGLPPGEKVNFFLDVKPLQDGEERTVSVSGGRIMMVQNLPSDCEVKLRFVLKDPDSGSACAVSKWVTARTVDVPPFQPDDEFELDLVGNKRGPCQQSKCPAYLPDNEGVGQNFDLSEARCLRCGVNVAAHEIPKPKEDPKEAKKAAEAAKVEGKSKAEPKPKLPPEPLLIEKAVALPKETIMARWRALDCKPDQKEWPRLPKDYREVVAWSDLHADMGQNMEHLERLPEAPEAVLVLAGDLATNLEIMESGFRLLKEKFGEVFYVPGNHELWVNKKDGLTSVHKFLAILELCERLGVHTRPAFISDECAVCPLFSWYKDNLVDGFTRDKANIAFDIQTQWPWDITGRGDTNDAQQHEIADWFAALNERRLEAAPQQAVEALKKAQAAEENISSDASPKVAKDVGEEDDAPSRLTVVSMSHFVPRQECYPGPRRLCGVMGCREIEDQVRRCGASCHVFGHSHIAIDRAVEHVRYVQHPLGYPSDYHRKSKPMRVWAETTASRGKDPEIAHQIALAEDGKWLVWNAVWGAMNADLADATGGPASEQYKSKSKEDMERASKHFKALKDTGALELQSVQRLRDQARFAGRSAALKAKVGEGLEEEEVETIRPPTELEATLWEKMMKAITLCAQAVAEQTRDAFLLRKGDEVWEMNAQNWNQCKYYESGKKFQADFEKHWSEQIAPDPEKVKKASENSGAVKKPKDPEKARMIALGGDAKWLVWNTVWYATNKGLANHHKGPAREQYQEKMNEDLERREEHVNKIRKTGALSEATLARLQDQAENGGLAAADHAKVGKELPALEVKALDPPPDIEAKLWSHMVRSTRFAAQATCESSLDAYSCRKADERWEMNPSNYHLCVHFHKAGVIQKRFESWWHNHVAPDPGENWEGASGVPEATLTKDLMKEFQDDIKNCNDKVMERPPGRWQDKESQWENTGDILSRDKETELQVEMGLEDETALWNTQKPPRDLDVKVTSIEDPNQQITVTVSNELLVRELKERIVEKVGRGPASKIILSLSGENVLDDDWMLSNFEDEVEQGVLLRGLDISAGKQVDVTIVHAISDTPQSLVIQIMDTSTILDLRRAIKSKLEERAISNCKLVKQLGNGFSSLKDDEKINGRTEFLFLGRDLPATAEEKKPEPEVKRSAVRRPEPKPSKPVEESKKQVEEPPPPPPAKDVTLTITHAMAGCSLQITVPEDSTFGDVRRALMAHLGENKLSQVKLVRRQGGEDGMIVSLGDSDRLNGKTSLLSMGREWEDAPAPTPEAPEPPPAAAVPAPEPPVEMTVTIVIDRDMDLKSDLAAMSGTPILRLKEQIAADDPTGSTSVDQFGLRLPGSGDPLPDDTLLTASMTELEISLIL